MIFGDHAYGEAPFAGDPTVFAPKSYDPEGFQAFLDEVAAERCYLIEMFPFSLAAAEGTVVSPAFGDRAFADGPFAGDEVSGPLDTTVLRYSDWGYTSAATDTPASEYYDGRASGPLILDKEIPANDVYGGLAVQAGSVSLLNQDGELDVLRDAYEFDGRPIDILVGRRTAARMTYGPVFKGVIVRSGDSNAAFAADVSDVIRRLDVPVQSAFYLGTGGFEGGSDLRGKPKPLTYGTVRNVSPVLIDAVNLRYQVHAGEIMDVPVVHDEQVPYTRITSGSPVGGEYLVEPATGTILIGCPPAGVLTADVLGDAPGGAYSAEIAVILYRLFGKAGLFDPDIDATSFLNIRNAVRGYIGVYITEITSVAAIADELLRGVALYGTGNRNRQIRLGVVTATEDQPVAAFDEQSILECEVEALPASITPIVWRIEVAYARNYTLQDRVAESVTTERREFVSQEYRWAVREDQAIRSQSLLARLIRVESPLADELDAQALANDLFALYASRRRIYRLRLPVQALRVELGDVVDLRYPRYGLAKGKSGRVVGYGLDASKGAVDLKVLA